MDPVYDRDGVTLYHGDCLVVLHQLLVTVQLVLEDLPYGTTRMDWDRPIDNKLLWHALAGLCGPRTPVVAFGTGSFWAELVMSNRADYRYDLIWDKQAVTGHLNAKKQPLRAHENIAVFYRQQPAYQPQMVFTGRSSHSRGSRSERTVNQWGGFENTEVVDQDGFQYPRSIIQAKRPKLPKGKGHPSQKPVELLGTIVRSFTAPGDLVLDPVAGSGSTLVAARTAGRRAIGIEQDPEWVANIIERLDSGSEGDNWP